MNLAWGVVPVLVDVKEDIDELFDHALETAENAGVIEKGDIAVLTAGVPLGVSGTTNMIKVRVAD